MPMLKQRSQNRLSSAFAGSNAQPATAPAAPRKSYDDNHLHASAARSNQDRNLLGNKLYKPGFARSAERLPSYGHGPQGSYPHPDHPPRDFAGRSPLSQLQTNSASNLRPPHPAADGVLHSRTAPPAQSHQPTKHGDTPHYAATLSPTGGAEPNKVKRRSWFGSSKDEKRKGHNNPAAWIVGHDSKLPYNLAPLLSAEKVPELWDEAGDTFVYLFPKNSNRGPSFRLDSSVFGASPALTRLAYGSVYSDQPPAHVPDSVRRKPVESALRHMSLPTSPPGPTDAHAIHHAETESSSSSKGSRAAFSDSNDSASSEVHLFLPVPLSISKAALQPGALDQKLNQNDIETVVTVRNFFAFLVGGALIGTERHASIFSIFLNIAKLLDQYEFSNFDGSTFGEVAATSFEKYVEELGMADVRASGEKTIEGIVLGERMRCWSLYNECFVHGVGKYQDIIAMKSVKYELISTVTRNRMERASMDLYMRQKNINARLEDFEFPAIFAGIMNSKTAEEAKLLRFDAWKSAFMATRKHVLGYYKHRYGSWLPKASSKKNNLETSGLNRLVLKDIYQDFSSLYDLLVDRRRLTTRGTDGHFFDDDSSPEDAVYRALRRVMSEYDRSSPPVQPPVPFDVPLFPDLASTRKDYGHGDAKKDAKARGKKIKSEELPTLLRASHNPDADVHSAFLDSYRELERRSAHGKTVDEAADFRAGAWIFMYAVLQSLPMLVVDAPGVRFTHNVEYFLCEVPRSGVPWARDADASQQRNWYGVAGGTGVVALPASVVEHGVEGIYRRSHCWTKAEQWTANSNVLAAAVNESLSHGHQPSPSHLPPGVHPSAIGPPPSSGSSLPMPPPPLSSSGSRPSSRPGSAGGLLRPGSSQSPGLSGQSRRPESVVMLGLEALPLPAGVMPDGMPGSRPGSSRGGSSVSGSATPNLNPVDPSITFDAILGTAGTGSEGKKKKR